MVIQSIKDSYPMFPVFVGKIRTPVIVRSHCVRRVRKGASLPNVNMGVSIVVDGVSWKIPI